MNDIIFRHYGSAKYDSSLFAPIKNRKYFIKPYGGLWVSPIDSEYGWKDWCEDEDFGDLTSHFDVVLDGIIMVIDSYFDAKDKLYWIHDDEDISFTFGKSIDFEAMLKDGIDAIWLTVEGERSTRYTDKHCLYGWDCESVLIMNKDIIKPL